MKITPLNSFLKFYVMTSPEIDLYGIAHVKVDFIPLQKMYVIPILGRFVWITNFVQYVCPIKCLFIRQLLKERSLYACKYFIFFRALDFDCFFNFWLKNFFNSKSLKSIFYKKGAKISWLHDFFADFVPAPFL